MAQFGFPDVSVRTAEFSSTEGELTRSISFDAVKWPRTRGWDVRLRVSVRFEPIEQVLNEVHPERRSVSVAAKRAYKTVDTLTINLTPPDLAFSAETQDDLRRAVPRVMDHLQRVAPTFFEHFDTLGSLITHLKSEQGHIYVPWGVTLVLPVCLAVTGAPAREVKDWIRRLTEKTPGHPSRVFLKRLGKRFPYLGLHEEFLDSLPKPRG